MAQSTAPCGVGRDGLVPLLDTPAYILTTLGCLVQRLVEVCQQSLKTAYTHTTLVGQLGRVGTVVARGVGNEEAYSPEVLAILDVELAVAGGNNGERLAHGVGNLLFDMLGDGQDIIHHARHVGKYYMVLTLKDVVGGVTCGGYNKGVVDEALAERLNLDDIALDGKLRGDGNKFLLIHIV